MDVLQQAGKAICQRDAERCQQVVPVRLHVFAGPALGIALAARVLVVWGDDVGDEVVITTGGLGGGNRCAYLRQTGNRYSNEDHHGGNIMRNMGGESRIIDQDVMRSL